MTKDNLKHEPPTDANNVIPAGLSTLKGYYIIGSIKGNPQTETISYQRKDAIKKFIADGNMTWEECQKYGWRCFKVDVVFQPCR